MIRDGVKMEKTGTEDHLITIERLLESLEDRIQSESLTIKNKVKRFLVEFDKEFPYPEEAYRRVMAEALSWALLDNIFFLYVLDLKDSLIIHLHGILERFCVDSLQEQFKPLVDSPTLQEHINRSSLYYSGRILKDFGIINNEILQFFKKLRDLRNPIAHRDKKKLAKIMGKKEFKAWLDSYHAVSNIDCIPLILNSIKSIIFMWRITTEGAKE